MVVPSQHPRSPSLSCLSTPSHLVMQRGGALVIRRLCGHMGAERSPLLTQPASHIHAHTLTLAHTFHTLAQRGGALVIRRLCGHMGAERSPLLTQPAPHIHAHAHTCPHFCTSMQRGGALVIRRLCGHMGAERVFTELSQILDQEEDLAFASTLVQASVGCLQCSHLCEGGMVVTGVRVGGWWSAATGDTGHLAECGGAPA